MKTKIVLVGGFLGAGKTTLLREAARRLSKKGKRVGLITNDQASELVDTAILEHDATAVSEVSGSCFCCNFPGFTDAIAYIKEKQDIDIIIAEPVGSCTDLSATILQPLKEKFANDLSIAPLSVLVDPLMLANILAGSPAGLHPSAAYIVRKQLEEADIIVINKTDLLTPNEIEDLKKRTTEEWPSASVFAISTKNGSGLGQWLEETLQRANAGTHLAEVDYDTYAEGEAVLGWLNSTFTLQSEAADWNVYVNNLLSALNRRFEDLHAAIGHVKLFIQAGNHFAIGNITSQKNSQSIRESAGVGKEAKLTVNARVQTDPDTLKSIVLEEVSKACGNNITLNVVALNCLIPGRPNPTYRFNHIVTQSC